MRADRGATTASVDASAKTVRGEQTRARILEAALALFKERGYEQATMRLIAESAGVSLGNAYYYFRSKEQLVQAFYGRTHEEHLLACGDALERETDLAERLRAVMTAKIETIEAYHPFAAVLFRTAADPQSPLHPLSEESRPVREESVALFARVLDGSKVKVPADLRQHLPELLWLYHLGIILFWIHDRSPDRARTRALAARTVDLVARLITLASVPLLRPLRTQVVRLLAELRTAAP